MPSLVLVIENPFSCECLSCCYSAAGKGKNTFTTRRIFEDVSFNPWEGIECLPELTRCAGRRTPHLGRHLFCVQNYLETVWSGKEK